MVTFVALALWLMMTIAPETRIGRSIRLWTVAKPAARLNRVTRGQVLLVLLLVTGASLIGWLIGHEAVRLMAMGLPDLLAMATMFEITAYLDAIAAIVTAASVSRLQTIKHWVQTVFSPRRATVRSRRSKSVPREAANDDEDSWAGLAQVA